MCHRNPTSAPEGFIIVAVIEHEASSSKGQHIRQYLAHFYVHLVHMSAAVAEYHFILYHYIRKNKQGFDWIWNIPRLIIPHLLTINNMSTNFPTVGMKLVGMNPFPPII